jgi:hypothetical protein
MQEASMLDSAPVPISSLDPESLRQLAQIYDGLAQEEVRVVAGDVVPELIEKSQELAGKIEEVVGATAVSETATVGILSLDKPDESILRNARRFQPKRLY